MIKEFKFLQVKKPLRTIFSRVKLKDQFNRNKDLYFNWSEYPDNWSFNPAIKQFNGNILEFFTFIKSQRTEDGYSITPTLYEIYGTQSGYFPRRIVLGNQHNHQVFISRKMKLKIIFSI